MYRGTVHVQGYRNMYRGTVHVQGYSTCTGVQYMYTTINKVSLICMLLIGMEGMEGKKKGMEGERERGRGRVTG